MKRRSNLSVLLQCDCLRQVSPLFLIVALIRDEAATVGQQTDHQRSGGNTKYPSFTFFLVHECPPGRIMRLPSCATVSAVLINACWTRANAARRIVSPLRRFQVAKPAPPALAIGRMAASSSRVDLQLDMLGGASSNESKRPRHCDGAASTIWHLSDAPTCPLERRRSEPCSDLYERARLNRYDACSSARGQK